uniref:Uncharacterized protein n=1 Tax=Dunaliella tertiolecta TaxID=3047 RepID=A0A7S3VIF6_DUNTE|mmetsp:Transcript_10130/g.26320  ORF Transcript_10130/g.26320 Transcript_10130/m.26320 type:complete len:109 (-) Transcript_10130:24-350(-)
MFRGLYTKSLEDPLPNGDPFLKSTCATVVLTDSQLQRLHGPENAAHSLPVHSCQSMVDLAPPDGATHSPAAVRSRAAMKTMGGGTGLFLKSPLYRGELRSASLQCPLI